MDTKQNGQDKFDLKQVLVQIITQVDELRIMFNRFGSGHDQMTDIIVARLLKNEEFFRRVAEHVVAIAKNAEPAMQDAIARTEKEQSSISASIDGFEGCQGFVEIELNSSGERVIGGMLTLDGADAIPLNVEIPTHVAILSGVNSCYMYHVRADNPKDIQPGDRIYFRINHINEAEILRAQRLMAEERRREAEVSEVLRDTSIDKNVIGILEA